MTVFSPSAYARANRPWIGSLYLNVFPRLFEATGSINEQISIDLDFSFDENDHIRVSGRVHTKAKLRCFACSIERAVPFTVSLDVRLVQTEREAMELFNDFDAIVLPDDKISIQELVEDDVLMGIPSRVCTDPSTCSHRPAEAEAKPSPTHRPFATIAQIAKFNR